MIGVIVGRFQVDEIHEGHLALLKFVQERHPQVLILVGCRHSPATKDNALDFHLRQAMLEQIVPASLILPVFDQPDDHNWSRQVDALIDGVFPGREATLYGGRESFIPHYHGRYKTRTLDFGHDGDSGTNVRADIAVKPRHTPDFRAGVIYGMQHLQPRIYLTVDIALLKGPDVLLGRKTNDKLWRFPGGFVDLKDESLEAAAKRELREETGMIPEGRMCYAGSFWIDDWRTRGISDAKHLTTLFFTEHSFGAPKAGDDLAEVAWFPIGGDVRVTASHQPLMDKIREMDGYKKEIARQFDDLTRTT